MYHRHVEYVILSRITECYHVGKHFLITIRQERYYKVSPNGVCKPDNDEREIIQCLNCQWIFQLLSTPRATVLLYSWSREVFMFEMWTTWSKIKWLTKYYFNCFLLHFKYANRIHVMSINTNIFIDRRWSVSCLPAKKTFIWMFIKLYSSSVWVIFKITEYWRRWQCSTVP